MIDLDQEMLHVGQLAGNDDDEYPQPVGDQRQHTRNSQQQPPRAQVVPIEFTLQRGKRERHDEEVQAAAAARDLERTCGNLDDVPFHRHGNARDTSQPDIHEGRHRLQQRVDQLPHRKREIKVEHRKGNAPCDGFPGR